MGQTLERMKEEYSKIQNRALAHAFSYMNLIEHWGSGIPRIIGKVKAAGLREPEFIGGEVDLRINIYRGQSEGNSVNNATNDTDGVKNGADLALNKEGGTVQKLLSMIAENPAATQAWYAEKLGVSKRTVSRMFVSLQEQGVLVRSGSRRKSNWTIRKKK